MARWVFVVLWVACIGPAVSLPQQPRYAEEELAAFDSVYAQKRLLYAYELSQQAPQLITQAAVLKFLVDEWFISKSTAATADLIRTRLEVRAQAEAMR
jgi:hypothetical protein